jgi:hypothetical protein
MKNALASLCAAAALLVPLIAMSETITVTAGGRDYAATPVRAVVKTKPGGPVLSLNGQAVPVQARKVSGGTELIWIVPELKSGQSLKYDLAFRDPEPRRRAGVVVNTVGTSDVDVRVNDEYFTRYDTRTGPNKPYFYPIFAPGNKRIVRRYGVEKVEGEEHDHPHHRGLWFTHGAVNGQDFWSEGPRAGKTVHTKAGEFVSGPVYGSFRAHTDWVANDGTKIAEDTRDFTIYSLPDGRLLDMAVTIKPVGGPLVFGDTKEGSMGIRIPDSMRLKGGDGRIVMSTGVKDAATWGKPAAWVDYYGTVEGQTLGVAILDHPQNLRHPTPWHVRDYGLFAANPFGLHDFTNDKANPKKGEHTVPADGSITFRYRVFIHPGTTTDARIADVWNGYANPPAVTVR